VGDNDIGDDKNAGKLTTISMAMVMQRYDAGSIAQWSTSRASLEANVCRHQASARIAAAAAMVDDYNF